MIDTSTTTTSLKNKPTLRWVLIALWGIVVAYAIFVFAQALPTYFKVMPSESEMPFGNLDSVLFTIFDAGVDLLLLAGFALIAFALFFRRTDDWFAIFISIFMITFAGRISNVVNHTATLPGMETKAGLLLALGDISIVLFVLLFPNGTFSPRWMKHLVPLLVISMLGIYAFPSAPFYWQKLGETNYLIFTSSWYLLSFGSFGYRYFRKAGVHQKQQMRWSMIGTLMPFLWFLIFNTTSILLTNNGNEVLLTTGLAQILIRISSLFAFLALPLFIALAVSRSKLFDIDLFIHRSMVYGGLTVGLGIAFALILGVFSLAFNSIQQGEQSMLAMTVSALGAGALFQPARKRLQRFIDKTIYNIKIEYDKTDAPLNGDTNSPQTDITLSNYKELKLIGRGGMASVYRGESPITGQRVAIKVLSTTLADDEQFRKRFMREAETVSSLSHSNIVRILNYGEENGTYFIVMEFLTGPDLHNLLKEQQRLALPESLLLLKSIASALDYAHQRGLVHRDIKPSNIMLDSTTDPARAVLTDFGIVKIADANTQITASRVLGTFDYIAPEQIQSSEEVDQRADIYALGVMTYQMLTGAMPFERSNTGALLLAHLTTPPPDASETNPDLPCGVSRAIQRAMAKKPIERFDTASEFISEMESIAV